MYPRLKMHVLSYSSRWTNSSEGCECDGSPVWEDARESVENCVGSRRDVDQEDAGAAEEIWLRILRPEIWHQVCSQPPREVGSWNLLGCFFFLIVSMFRFHINLSLVQEPLEGAPEEGWARPGLHPEKAEAQRGWNATGEGGPTLSMMFFQWWLDFHFMTFFKVHKNTKMGSVQEHDNEAGPECFKCGQVKVLF